MGRAMNSRRDGSLSFCLFALLFSVYLLTFSGIYHSSDEMSMLTVTDSLARRGAWDIELIRWTGEQQGSFGPDGHLYSRKGIGMTLAALPFYWAALQLPSLGNVQTATLTNAVVTALTGVLVYRFLRRLGYRAGVSLGTALAFGLGTMAWPYARYLFSESLASLGLMSSAYFLLCYRERRDRSSLLLAGAGLGLAMLARLNTAIALPFVGLLLLAYVYRHHGLNWRAWLGPVVLFSLPLLAALAVTGWYNWLRFGNALTTGYLPEERFATPFLEGFYGLTFSPGKGLFWYNPLLFVALAAWPAFLRRHRAEALLAGSVVLTCIAFYSPWYLWWAGHGWGPRFLVGILPFATLSLAPALEAALRRRTLAMALGTLAALSLATQLLATAVDFNLYLEEIYAQLGLYHPATLFNPAYSPLLRQIAYLRPENLDLAWARHGSIDWPALLTGSGLVLLSGLALWAACRRQPHPWIKAALLLLLVLGAPFSLLRYAPTGDVAEAASTLAAAERPNEAAALTDLLLTDAFQDAYDGHLSVWGVPAKKDITVQGDATWVIGGGDLDLASGPPRAGARFQIGTVHLDLYLPPGQHFDPARLPAPQLADKPRLGEAVELVAVQLGHTTAHQGETLPVTLYWRALAAMDVSYTVFVQMIGVKAGQVDRPPCDGGCPTTTWQPGDVVGERYDLSVRPDAPPGSYQLITGMYGLTTGENLPWFDPQGDAIGSYLPLGTVLVQP
jgi:4-amino-4-deoxy-L-arabinose transferase-like glycosyltransferase